MELLLEFEIDGRLPTLNEYIDKSRRNKYIANYFKKTYEEQIINIIKDKQPIVEYPIIIEYNFYEMNKKRDLDNVAGMAHKLIQDGMVKGGLIENDGWKQISGFRDYFYIDKEQPRIVVKIYKDIDCQLKAS